jgi:hypothetical protein
MIKRYIYLMVTFILLVLSCKKKDDPSPVVTITSKSWKWATVDKNSLTNPQQGNVLYYSPNNCERDDSFQFSSNNQLLLNRGLTKCDPNEPPNEAKTYSLNRTTNELIIDGIKYFLVEESPNQLKYYRNIPAGSGFNYLVYILE